MPAIVMQSQQWAYEWVVLIEMMALSPHPPNTVYVCETRFASNSSVSMYRLCFGFDVWDVRVVAATTTFLSSYKCSKQHVSDKDDFSIHC